MIPQAPSSTDSWLTRVTSHPLFASSAGIVALAMVAWLVDRIASRILVRIVDRIIKKTSATWDDAFLENKAFHRLAHLAPAMVVYYGIMLVPGLSDPLASAAQRITGAVTILLAAVAIGSAISAVADIARDSNLARGRPLRAYFQVATIAVYVVAGLLFLASLLGQNPIVLLSGIGAATAVLVLVFRDTIVSFVSSLQITWYDMVRVGDWIEVPEFGADGDVERVDLLTVSVRNWDRTITTIPTYRLTQGSFKNWRFMSESGGRRVKRPLVIDMESIRFLTPDDLDHFERYDLLTEYVTTKRRELAEYNAEHVHTPDVISNVRRLTNIGTFRAYIRAYLQRHPKVHHSGFTQMVRQLAPTTQGLPLEIYVFLNDTNWVNYEGIQADIFDHLLAIAPEFGLRVFQTPTGGDIRALSGHLSNP
jgi:miniconductance mechanosensitive channel